jgi:hypothetical protein
MLIELPQERYELVRNIKEAKVFPIINSVICRKQEGKIFVDSEKEPAIAFIAHKSAFCYLYTRNELASFDPLFSFLHSNASIPGYFHIYNPPPNLMQQVVKFKGFNNRIRDRVRMKRTKPLRNISGLTKLFETVKSISEIDQKDILSFNLGITEKYWQSMEDFVKNGYGWVAYVKDKPAAIYYTVCLVNKNAEVDIFTVPEFLGRGLAVLAGMKFLQDMDQKGINIDWDAFTDNTPSIKLGEGFGYTPYLNYPLLSLFKN